MAKRGMDEKQKSQRFENSALKVEEKEQYKQQQEKRRLDSQ